MSILSKTRSIFLTILFTLVIIVSMVGAFILIRFPLSNIYYHNKYLKEKNRHNITAYEYSGKPGRVYSPLKLKDKKISDILNKKNISIISGIFETSDKNEKRYRTAVLVNNNSLIGNKRKKGEVYVYYTEKTNLKAGDELILKNMKDFNDTGGKKIKVNEKLPNYLNFIYTNVGSYVLINCDIEFLEDFIEEITVDGFMEKIYVENQTKEDIEELMELGLENKVLLVESRTTMRKYFSQIIIKAFFIVNFITLLILQYSIIVEALKKKKKVIKLYELIGVSKLRIDFSLISQVLIILFTPVLLSVFYMKKYDIFSFKDYMYLSALYLVMTAIIGIKIIRRDIYER